jgi:MFS family permease
MTMMIRELILAKSTGSRTRRSHWVSLAIISATHAEQHAVAAIQPLIFPYVMAALGFNYATLGALLAVANLVNGLLQGVHAWTSRYLRRRTIIGLGGIGMGLSLGCMALAQSFAQFGGAMIFGRIASSAQHPLANSLMSDWYEPERRGRAFSIHFSGGNVGSVITPIVAGYIITRFGWHMALYALMLPGLVFGMLAALFVTDDRKIMRVATAEATQSGERLDYLAPLRNSGIRLVILACSVAAGGRGLGIVMVYVPLYLSQGLHYNMMTTSILFTVMMVGSVVGPMLAGHFSDRFGRKPLIVGSLMGASIATIALILAGRTMPGLVGALILLGFTVYNESPLMQAFLSDHTKRENRDAAFAVFYVLTYAAGAAWAGILGLLVNRFGFEAAFLSMVASYVVASLVTLRIRPPGAMPGSAASGRAA